MGAFTKGVKSFAKRDFGHLTRNVTAPLRLVGVDTGDGPTGAEVLAEPFTERVKKVQGDVNTIFGTKLKL